MIYLGCGRNGSPHSFSSRPPHLDGHRRENRGLQRRLPLENTSLPHLAGSFQRPFGSPILPRQSSYERLPERIQVSSIDSLHSRQSLSNDRFFLWHHSFQLHYYSSACFQQCETVLGISTRGEEAEHHEATSNTLEKIIRTKWVFFYKYCHNHNHNHYEAMITFYYH